MVTVEGTHTTKDGTKLYTKTWKTESTPKVRLVFIHGFSDHCNIYENLFPSLTTHGIEVLSFDQRGWGRSCTTKSSRGLTGPTSLVLSDITSFLTSVLPSTVPVFLMGHSMGGGELLTYMADGPAEILSQIRGFLVEAPFVAVSPATRPSSITVVLGRLTAKVLPHMQMKNEIDLKLVSRDPVIQKAMEKDELCHNLGTLQGLAGMLDRAANLESGRVVPSKGIGEGGVTRLWISHGTEDGVCSFAASKDLAERWKANVEDIEFKAYEGWYHRLHDEPGELKVTYAKDVVDWIFARLPDSDSDPKSRL